MSIFDKTKFYGDPMEGYISETVQDMSFQLVPNSVTLNDFALHNSPQVCVISPNSVVFTVHYVKVVEDTRILSAGEM